MIVKEEVKREMRTIFFKKKKRERKHLLSLETSSSQPMDVTKGNDPDLAGAQRCHMM